MAQAQQAVMSLHDYRQQLNSANKASDSQSWEEAIQKWNKIVQLNPVNGDYWYKLGESYYHSGYTDKAIEAFKKSLKTGDPAPFESACFIARCYAKSHDKTNALAWLQQTVDMGYRHLENIRRDTSFREYFDDSRFRKIVGIPPGEFKNRVDGWRFDLALLIREIKRKSPAPFRYTSERKFDSIASALNTRIPSLTDLQVIIELEKIMVLVGDGHTMIYAFFERPEFRKNLPVNFRWFEEGLYITEADKRYQHLLGCRVMAFDYKTTEEILKGIDPIINRDNEVGPKVLGVMRMRTIPLLFGLGLVKSPDEIVLTVKDNTGNIKKVAMKADCPVSSRQLWDQLPDNWLTFYQYENKEPPLYLQHVFTHYWFHYFQNERTVYFQYNRISDDAENRFDHFCDNLFAFIDKNDVDKLVIDVRWNNGGNTSLVSYLLNKIIACRKINQKGKLFAIIAHRTFSATINMLGYLEGLTPVILIGEQTGSSPNFIGEDNPFELPYSRLMANVSDVYWQCSWPMDHRKWFTPFMYIPTRFRDFISSKDPALDLVLNFRND